jgi:hypothetical protein
VKVADTSPEADSGVQIRCAPRYDILWTMQQGDSFGGALPSIRVAQFQQARASRVPAAVVSSVTAPAAARSFSAL